MKKDKKWKGILLIILVLAIGFAAVSTTLFINGTINFGINSQNFKDNLIFTDATLDYSDTAKTDITDKTALIKEDGKKIEFTTETMTTIGETATLTYEISNNTQYTADLAEIACTVKDKNDNDVTAKVMPADNASYDDYIKIVASTTDTTLAPTEKLTGATLVVTLRKSYAEENPTSYTVTCTIDADPIAATAPTTTANASSN